MNPINIEIDRKISNLNKKSAMFKELLKFTTKDESVKLFVLCYSAISLGVAFFFLHTLIHSHVRVSLSYSVFNFILFFLVGCAGFLTFYLNSELYTRYFFFVLVAHCLVNLLCLFVGIYTVQPNLDVRNEIKAEVTKFKDGSAENPPVSLDDWHLSLSCCGVSGPDQFKKNGDQYALPLSCCDELDQDLECSPAIAKQQGCWAAYQAKVKSYRIVAFILLSLSAVLEVLLIMAYSRTVEVSEG